MQNVVTIAVSEMYSDIRPLRCASLNRFLSYALLTATATATTYHRGGRSYYHTARRGLDTTRRRDRVLLTDCTNVVEKNNTPFVSQDLQIAGIAAWFFDSNGYVCNDRYRKQIKGVRAGCLGFIGYSCKNRSSKRNTFADPFTLFYHEITSLRCVL